MSDLTPIKINTSEWVDKSDLNKGLIVSVNGTLRRGDEYYISETKSYFTAASESLIIPNNDMSGIKWSTLHNFSELSPTGIKRAFESDKLENQSERTILQEAQDLVYGDRQADYGNVRDNFEKIAKLWSPILGVEPTAEQVGLCMVQLKIARQLHKPKRDNLVDGAGYFATLEKMEREDKN